MPYNPKDVVYPKNRIKKVIRVLHDGTQSTPDGFSIAEIELQNGEKVFGLRHNYNYWNEDNPDIGYPTVRPGNPTWFILPDVNALQQVINTVFPSPPVV
ncbi:hypothetical protein WBJ53_16255 [Spirosoma sp. SC4-14]|uniref:hypothetical protein n=1 Tax=Spirosoma sp. SC4-14 TaxID=3128900 RepID=UPI0030D214F1